MTMKRRVMSDNIRYFMFSKKNVIHAPLLATVILWQVDDSYILFRHRKGLKLSGIDSRSRIFLVRQCERLQPKVHDADSW